MGLTLSSVPATGFTLEAAKAPRAPQAPTAPQAPAPQVPTAPKAPAPPKLPATVTGAVKRETYDAKGRELDPGQFGTLVRKEGQGPSGDAAVDKAHDNAKIVYDFYKQVLGRDSLDGKGMVIKSTVHFGDKMNNAFWDGERMAYGDGDGKRFAPLTGALDVVSHEMTHAVTEHTGGLDYSFQPGALNESWSDVMGELAEQWHENPTAFGTLDGAKKADWMIGEDVFTPGVAGDALRSMKAPGTAYRGDPQPDHMSKFLKKSAWDDNGGVHYNSGIPNRAAYEAALKVGSEKVAKIWYRALTNYIKPNSQFSDAAWATLSAAKDLYATGPEAQAILDAWKAVGIEPSKGAPKASTLPTVTVSRRDKVVNPGIVPPWLTQPAAPTSTA